MKIRINNPNIDGNESTLITVAVSAAGTSLTVQNTEGFSANDYVVVGHLGDEQTELRQISSTSGNNTIVVDALSFAHSINTPLTFIDFNQVEVHSASSETGTYTVISGSPSTLEVDDDYTEVEDTVGTSSTWYKIRYYNSTTATYSDFSDAIKGTGYVGQTLRKILDKIYLLAHDDKKRSISEDDMVEFVNDAYQKAINRLMKADHKRFMKKGYVSVKDSYDTGTVSINDGATSVTGSGTTWGTSWTNKKILFETEGYPYEISSVDSTTGITLTRAYDGAGSNLSGSDYTIYQDEHDIVDASTGEVVTDFKRIEQVFDEDGNQVYEYDPHRTENGWYIKREGDDLKFCLNYIPNTSDYEGRWLVFYLYQPTKLDTVGDEPEIPLGFDDLLIDFGIARIKERIGELTDARYFDKRFEDKLLQMTRYTERRGNQLKGFRLDQNLRGRTEHDADWIDDIYSRATVSQ